MSSNQIELQSKNMSEAGGEIPHDIVNPIELTPAPVAVEPTSVALQVPETLKTPTKNIVEIPHPDNVTGITLPEEIAGDERFVDALTLFDAGYSIYMAKDEASMSPEEQAKRRQVQGIIEKIKENQEGLFYTNKFSGKDEKGKTKSYRIREYLPTDDIIVFLTSEIAREELPLETRDRYWKVKYLLEKASKPSTVNKAKDPDKYVARVNQEIKFIKENNLGSNLTEVSHKASARLHGRYELRITKRTKPLSKISVPQSPFGTAPVKTVPPPIPPTPPEPAPVLPTNQVPVTISEAPAAISSSEPPKAPEPPIPAPVQTPENDADIEPAPVTPSIEDLRFDFHFVNRTEDVKKRAREIAELQLREELRRGKWYNPKDWFRKMKIRVAEEYYRQKYTERAREAMIQNNNSYLQMDVVKNAAIDATHKIEEERRAGVAKAQAAGDIHELQSQGMTFEGQKTEEVNTPARTLFMDHLIRPAVASLNGLNTTELNDISNMTNAHRERMMNEVQEKMRTWIQATYDRRVLQGITDPAVRTALQDPTVAAQLQEYFGKKSTDYGVVADYFASDIVDMAQQIQRNSRAHNFAVDVLLNKSKIVLARMSWAAETEAKLSATDRAVSWAQSHRVTGAVLNPATIGAAVSIGTYSLTKGSAALGRVANIVAPGAGGLAGGIFAGIRRGMDLKKDRAAHQVEMTYGAQGETRADVDRRLDAANLNFVQRRLAEAAGAYRRADLERFAYDSKSATALVGAVDALKGALSDVANRESLAKNIAEIKARLDYSSSAHVDLITFEGREQVEQQRLALIKSIAEGKVALRNAGMSDSEINARIASEHADFLKLYDANVTSKDKSFRRYRAVQSLKATGRGALVGVGVAAAGQGVAWGANEVLHRIYDNHDQSIVDVLGPGHSTLEYQQASHDVDFIGKSHLSGLYADTKPHVVNLSDELAVKIQPNHEVRFVNTHIGFEHYDVEAAHLNPDGSISLHGPLTDEIKKELQEAHFQINETTSQITSEVAVPQHADFATGFRTDIPDGTEWVKDTHGWDLVVSSDRSQVLVNDAVFSSQGVIEHFDTEHSLLHQIDQGKYIHVIHEMFNGKGEWKEGVQLGKYEWYSYNQPGSQLNELKLFNYKMGDTVRLSMHNMHDSWQNGLSPERINVPTVYEGMDIQGGKAGFAFSLPGHLKEPLIALTDKDGYLDLNPQDHDPSHLLFYINPDGEVKSMPLGDFSRMVLNHDAYKDLPDGGLATELRGRYDIWKVGGPNGEFGFISAGRYVEQNGQRVWQSFATIRGTATPELTAPSATTEIIVNHPSIDHLVTDHTIVESTTISPPFIEEIPTPPPVAVPFVPRYPLEELVGSQVPSIPQTVANEASAELGTAAAIVDTAQRETSEKLRYQKRRDSEGKVTLVDHEGRPIKRDTERERRVLTEYISNIKRDNPEYHAELTTLLPQMIPMSNKTRVVVNIPAHVDDKEIIEVLKEYFNQVDGGAPIDPDTFQVNVIVNQPIDKVNNPHIMSRLAKILEEEEIKTGKRFHFRLIEPIKRFNTMGEMQRVLNDLTIMNSLRREKQDGPLYILSESSMLAGTEKDALSKVIHTMDQHPELDVAYGRRRFKDDEIVKNDFLFMKYLISLNKEHMVRLTDMKEMFKPGLLFVGDAQMTGGGNTVVTAESYALAGGNDGNFNQASNRMLADRITRLRGEGGEPNVYAVGNIEAVSYVDPNRFIRGVAEQIQDTPSTETNVSAEELQQQLSAKLNRFATLSDMNKNTFESLLNTEYTWLQSALKDPVQADPLMLEILYNLGFGSDDYVVERGTIKVKNWERVKAKLSELRTIRESARHAAA